MSYVFASILTIAIYKINTTIDDTLGKIILYTFVFLAVVGGFLKSLSK